MSEKISVWSSGTWLKPPESSISNNVDMKSLQAVILVGGQGTRLRPLTLNTPKPLLPTAGYPFLLHLLTRIRESGITNIVLGTSFKAELFESTFGDGSDYGINLTYIHEPSPLGTGGGIRNVLPALNSENVVIFNGDVLGGTNISAVVNTHISTNADVTLHLVRARDPRAFGCVPTDADGRVLRFLEKTQDPPTDQINGGCYVFKTSVIESIPTGRPVSIEREVFPGLLTANKHLQGHVDNSYWRDMGTPSDFVSGSADLVRGIAPSGILPHTSEALIHKKAEINQGVVITGGSVVDHNVVIKNGARIDGSIIYDSVLIEPGVTIERSIICSGAKIGARSLIKDCVIGENAVIGPRCELVSGARIWPGVNIPEAGIRFSTDV